MYELENIFFDGVHLASPYASDLHAYAAEMGIKRCHFDSNPKHPHYDIPKKYKGMVQTSGIMLVSSKKLVKECFRK